MHMDFWCSFGVCLHSVDVHLLAIKRIATTKTDNNIICLFAEQDMVSKIFFPTFIGFFIYFQENPLLWEISFSSRYLDLQWLGQQQQQKS